MMMELEMELEMKVSILRLPLCVSDILDPCGDHTQQDINQDPLHGQHFNKNVRNANGNYQGQDSDVSADEEELEYVESDKQDEAPKLRSYRGREVPIQA